MIVGEQIGRLVVQEVGLKIDGRKAVRCQCSCEKQRIVREHYLTSGRVKSCGCYKRDQYIERNSKHGASRRGKASPTYRSWAMAKVRCLNSNFPTYPLYGGRGITMCQEWSNSFLVFLAYMGERPLGKTLDRIDTNGNYEPGNCRWATHQEQCNNRRDNRWFTLDGETDTISGWSRRLGMNSGSLYKMLVYRGMSLQQISERRMEPIR